MNNYDTANLSYLRKRYGLFWYGHRFSLRDLPPNLLRNTLLIAFLLACYVIVALNDAHADALATEHYTSQMLVNLANGGTIISDDGSFAARCEHMVEVTN